MAYTALYRKWRPRVFGEVVGQDHITMTLKNQIKGNNIAHAYLFCGTRGTGKTSTAKIFARAVNCLNPQDHDPCNECEVCAGILNESIMDVVEIDAASNNGVDNIRELRENIKYPPSKAKYKVYIVDEVHMLSQGAFNALLKTLEEPPEYVIFILATTEPHKIPGTILSRCQRFDFKRIGFDSILNRLKYICENMDIKAEEGALKLIVRNSDGAVRDSLSILDQCISFTEGDLTYEKTVETLGIVTDEFLYKLTDSIYNEKSDIAIKLIDDLINSGKDIGQFVKDLINHFRNLMMTKMSDDLQEVIDLSNESIERLKEQGKNFNINTIIRALNILSECETQIKWSSQPRIFLELSIIKLIRPNYDDSYEGLLDRIEKMEKKLENLSVKGIESLSTNTYISNNKVSERKEDNLVELNKNNNEKTNNTYTSRKESAEVKNNISEIPNKTPKKDEERKNINIDIIRGKWKDILEQIKKKKVSVHAVLIEGSIAGVEDNKLIIAFKEKFWFHKDLASKKPNKEIIEESILEFTGQNIRIKCVMEDEIEKTEVHEEDTKNNNVEEEVKMVKEFFSDFEDKLEIIDG